MASLFSEKQQYPEAADCLHKVLSQEDQETAKVGLYTKIAGNFKKADDSEKSMEASKKALELMTKL